MAPSILQGLIFFSFFWQIWWTRSKSKPWYRPWNLLFKNAELAKISRTRSRYFFSISQSVSKQFRLCAVSVEFFLFWMMNVEFLLAGVARVVCVHDHSKSIFSIYFFNFLVFNFYILLYRFFSTKNNFSIFFWFCIFWEF